MTKRNIKDTINFIRERYREVTSKDITYSLDLSEEQFTEFVSGLKKEFSLRRAPEYGEVKSLIALISYIELNMDRKRTILLIIFGIVE